MKIRMRNDALVDHVFKEEVGSYCLSNVLTNLVVYCTVMVEDRIASTDFCQFIEMKLYYFRPTAVFCDVELVFFNFQRRSQPCKAYHTKRWPENQPFESRY
jgi:hypothetical protein